MKTVVKPTSTYHSASWFALIIGVLGFMLGLYNAEMLLSEKGFYFATLCLGLYSSVTLQKAVRDRLEGIEVTNMYYTISWFAFLIAIALTVTGLWNASLLLSEKGFYAMAFVLSLFASVTIQKNIRDLTASS